MRAKLTNHSGTVIPKTTKVTPVPVPEQVPVPVPNKGAKETSVPPKTSKANRKEIV